MSRAKLIAELGAVDWSANITAFSGEPDVEELSTAMMRIAVWARQLEQVDKGNPALCFIRELQISAQYVVVQASLGLYKGAAASMRSMLETALYYTFFRTHLAELQTLANTPSYYVDKNVILAYHKLHTQDFTKLQAALGLNSRLESWYSFVSGIVHGQLPGTWVEHTRISGIKHIPGTQKIVVDCFTQGEEIVHRLFLCTIGRAFWDSFSTPAKRHILVGLPGQLRAALQLDIA